MFGNKQGAGAGAHTALPWISGLGDEGFGSVHWGFSSSSVRGDNGLTRLPTRRNTDGWPVDATPLGHPARHQTAQMLLASSCPSGSRTPRLGSREACARSYSSKEPGITQCCLPQAWGSVSKLSDGWGEPPDSWKTKGCCTTEGYLGRVRGKPLKCSISHSRSLVCPASSQLFWTKRTRGPFPGHRPAWEPKEPALEPDKSSPFPGLRLLSC